MGAEGNIVIARRDEFEAANPDVSPSDLELYTGRVLGIDAVWGYCGDNLYDWNNYITPDSVPEEVFKPETAKFVQLHDNERETLRQAAMWFQENSEVHEVWT